MAPETAAEERSLEQGLDEATARRIVLARAIETGDPQGQLLSTLEREQIDGIARQQAQAGTDAAAVLDRRAQQVLQIVHIRSPVVAALQAPRPWQRWLAPGALGAALLLGALGDRIANPHRVDLLSLPLLALVAWNLVVYALLAVAWWRGRGAPAAARPSTLLTALQQAADALRGWRGRSGRVQAQVGALFFTLWHSATAALNLQRGKGLLHGAAAGWGLGVALSLFARGLVVEYRVGWESTFLDAAQVHALLSVLLAPAVWLFSFEPFTVQEVAGLKFGAGGQGAAAGARWVYLYAGLLSLVVIAPRLLLAWQAHRRARRLARAVAIDGQAPYFQALLARLYPAQLRLGLAAAHEEGRAALRRLLLPGARDRAPSAHGAPELLIRSADGDELSLVDVPLEPPAPDGPAPSAAGPALPALLALPAWAGRAGRALGFSRPSAATGAGAGADAPGVGCDLLLLVVRDPADLQAAAALGRRSGLPGLLLVHAPDRAAAPDHGAIAEAVRSTGLPLQALFFADFARCWVQHPALFAALERALPEPQRAGCARLAQAWEARAQERFARSMAAIAGELVDAARQSAEVQAAPLSVKHLVSPVERRSSAQARTDAMAALAARLEQRAAETHAALLELHGASPLRDRAGADNPGPEAPTAAPPRPAQPGHFRIQEAVHAPQAGMAGAATGAAMGASVDLVTGGLTLGAAAALGALAGGSAAFVAAAWKNRAAPGGATQVQPSDELLQALAEAALLDYLAVVHDSAVARGDQPQWRSEVVAAIEARRERFTRLWAAAREPASAGQAAASLASECEAAGREVLGRLYPQAERSGRKNS